MSYRHPDSTPAGNYGSAFAMRQDALWKVRNDDKVITGIHAVKVRNLYLNLSGSIPEISEEKHQSILDKINSISSKMDIYAPSLKHNDIVRKGIKKLKEVINAKEIAIIKKYSNSPYNKTMNGKYILSLIFMAKNYKDTPLAKTADSIKELIYEIDKSGGRPLINYEICDELSNKIFNSIITTEPVEPLNYEYRVNYEYRINVMYETNKSFDKMRKKPDFQQAHEIYDTIKEHYDETKLFLERDPLFNKMIQSYHIFNYTHNLAHKIDKMLSPNYSFGKNICNIT